MTTTTRHAAPPLMIMFMLTAVLSAGACGGGGSTPPPDGSGPSDSPTTLDETPPVAAIASDHLRMNDRGFVKVKIDCGDSPEDCVGDVGIWLRLPGDDARTRVGRAEFDIAAGDSHRVKLRLKRRARRFVRDEGEVHAKVVAHVHDAAGNTDKLRKRLTLRLA